MADRRSQVTVGSRRWPALVGAGAAVVAAGFALGIVAGILWEEPGMVIAYLTGNTDRVEWGAEPDSAAAEGVLAGGDQTEPPSVAAAPPLGARRLEDALAPPREQSEPAAVSQPVKRADPPASEALAAAARSGFSVQVGAFADREAADGLAGTLRGAGYPVYLSRGEGAAGTWRVRVGPLPTREEAESAGRRLKSEQKLPIWVLSEDS